MTKKAKITTIDAYNYGFEGVIQDFIIINNKPHYQLFNGTRKVLARCEHTTILQNEDVYLEQGWE
jgi:hypothetical protein